MHDRHTLRLNTVVNIGLCYKDINAYSWEQKHGIQNIGIEGSKGNIRGYKRQVLKIWENYIIELYNQPNQPENLEDIPEKEVDADKKGPCVLQNEVEETVKKMRDQKSKELYSHCWEKTVSDK